METKISSPSVALSGNCSVVAMCLTADSRQKTFLIPRYALATATVSARDEKIHFQLTYKTTQITIFLHRDDGGSNRRELAPGNYILNTGGIGITPFTHSHEVLTAFFTGEEICNKIANGPHRGITF